MGWGGEYDAKWCWVQGWKWLSEQGIGRREIWKKMVVTIGDIIDVLGIGLFHSN